MDMISIAVCDDDTKHIAILEKYLFEISDIKIECDAYQNGESLVNAYKNSIEKYDVVFLDMEMEKLNGIETADRIREFDEHVIIVFVTSHSEYMKESFRCQPFRFIEKPLDYDELKKIFCDIKDKLSKKRKVFSFTENKTRVRLFCDDILYCESRAHWVWIYTKDQAYKICKTLSEVYEQLDREMMFRVHKSFVVNFNYIFTIKENNIRLYHCDKLIPVSRSYKKAFLEEYTNFIERNLYV